jgi:hypothetical protein
MRVKIFNRFDGTASHIATVSNRLSNAVVSLLSQGGSTLKTYSIGSALNIAEFNINFDY